MCFTGAPRNPVGTVIVRSAGWPRPAGPAVPARTLPEMSARIVLAMSARKCPALRAHFFAAGTAFGVGQDAVAAASPLAGVCGSGKLLVDRRSLGPPSRSGPRQLSLVATEDPERVRESPGLRLPARGLPLPPQTPGHRTSRATAPPSRPKHPPRQFRLRGSTMLRCPTSTTTAGTTRRPPDAPHSYPAPDPPSSGRHSPTSPDVGRTGRVASRGSIPPPDPGCPPWPRPWPNVGRTARLKSVTGSAGRQDRG